VLLLKGGQYILGDPYLGLLAVGLFIFARVMNSKHSDLNFPGALVVFIIGIGYGFYTHGMPPVQFNVPLDPYLPTLDDLVQGTYKAGIAQLPLTLTNAVLATSLLASDLFKEKISNRKLSITIGSANVISPLMGGFPMCHGAGGMAAHYQFGARTGGADVMIGAIFILISFVATSPMLALIPAGILGTLLFFAGVEMLVHAARTDRMLVTGTTGVVTMIIDPTVGLAAGIVMFLWSKLFRPGGWPSPWFKQKS
jgi:MFS superfamily sulfate permease-like transporter